MNDTRLTQVTALLDDARSLLIDVVDDGPGLEARDSNRIDAARQFINSAIEYVQAAMIKPEPVDRFTQDREAGAL